MGLRVMYLRPRPHDSLWAALCSQSPATVVALGLWALAMLALATQLDFEQLLPLLSASC